MCVFLDRLYRRDFPLLQYHFVKFYGPEERKITSYKNFLLVAPELVVSYVDHWSRLVTIPRLWQEASPKQKADEQANVTLLLQ
jgi:hypothetical protein